MIGGGGNRIGRPPTGVPAAPQGEGAPQKAGDANHAPAPRPSDSFEKNVAAKGLAGPPKPTGLTREGTPSDFLKLARDNPQAALRIADGMAAQAKGALGEIEREMVAARNVLQSLANEKFTKAARDKVAQQLKKHREKLQGLKGRYHTSLRKMGMLQQVAGRLRDSELEEEIDKLLSRHGKLQTDWGRRHHLLSLGELLFGDEADTPEHLREVVRADVRGSPRNDAMGDAIAAISPRRIIAELVARTLDGTTRPEGDLDKRDALRGELGRSLQSYAMLGEALEESLGADPLARGDGDDDDGKGGAE